MQPDLGRSHRLVFAFNSRRRISCAAGSRPGNVSRCRVPEKYRRRCGYAIFRCIVGRTRGAVWTPVIIPPPSRHLCFFAASLAHGCARMRNVQFSREIHKLRNVGKPYRGMTVRDFLGTPYTAARDFFTGTFCDST